MSTASYSVPAQTWQTELEIKRSKFLTLVSNASCREQAEDFIRALRAEHPQANHVCWAYIAGSPNTTVRSMSDDGEPSGTAGMPMLKVLQHSGLGDIAVAVVRYFGGVKLGTGGLQRAYSDAVSQALAALPIKLKVHRTPIKLRYDYAYEAIISRVLSRFDVEDMQTKYGQDIEMQLLVASLQQTSLRSELTNSAAGNIVIRPIE